MDVCSYILTQQLLAAMKTTIHQTQAPKNLTEQSSENLSNKTLWPPMKETVNCPPKSLVCPFMVRVAAGQQMPSQELHSQPLAYRVGHVTHQRKRVEAMSITSRPRHLKVQNLPLPLFSPVPAQCRGNDQATRWKEP